MHSANVTSGHWLPRSEQPRLADLHTHKPHVRLGWRTHFLSYSISFISSLGNLLEIVPVHLLVAPLLRGKESTPSRAVGLQRGTAFFASFLPLLLWF